jgi:hypothetical protein
VIRFHSTSGFSALLCSFRDGFSKRSWPYWLATAVGWLIHTGQRHVRRLCSRANWRRHESGYYRFFSDFKFHPERFAKKLLELIIREFGLTELLIAVDDTLCPKWGKKIFGTAFFYDHVKRPKPGYIWGHDWVVLAVVVRLFGVPISLPFWVSLYRPRKLCAKGEFQTRLEIVAAALRKVKAWFPQRISLVVDGAYFNKSLLRPLAPLDIDVVGRLRSDAALRSDPPARGKRTGRKKRYGKALPKLKQIAKSSQGWQTTQVTIYGKVHRLRFKVIDAWWKVTRLKIRVVISRALNDNRPPAYLAATDLSLSPKQIIERFALRWPIEQLFSDAKQIMGLDSAEIRGERGVRRHAQFTFSLVTLTRLWAKKSLHPLPHPPTSFRNQLSKLRADLLAQTISRAIPPGVLSARKRRALAELAAA